MFWDFHTVNIWQNTQTSCNFWYQCQNIHIWDFPSVRLKSCDKPATHVSTFLITSANSHIMLSCSMRCLKLEMMAEKMDLKGWVTQHLKLRVGSEWLSTPCQSTDRSLRPALLSYWQRFHPNLSQILTRFLENRQNAMPHLSSFPFSHCTCGVYSDEQKHASHF